MRAVFYTFSKRENSTARPGGGLEKSVVLKEGCSTSSPSIYLKWDGASSPALYNYMYLPAFRRYYYVSWTYEDRQWCASGTVDVLASFKDEIGAETKYILRAASEHNYNVVDRKYPPVFPFETTAFGWKPAVLSWAEQFSAGQYIVSVVGTNDSFGVGGSSYYAMGGASLDALIDAAFTETANIWSTPLTGGALSDTLADYGLKFFKSIANPAQFINSIYWVPFKVSGATARPLKLGDLQTYASGHPLTDPITIIPFSWRLPGSPGGPATGQVEPFMTYTLYLPPFGTFELDARVIYQYYGVEGRIIVDVTCGDAVLEVYGFGAGGAPIISASASIGTPITIAGTNVDYAGLEKTSLMTARDAAGSLMRLDIAGAVTGAAAGIIDAAQAGAPSATNGGYGGGLAALRGFMGVVVSSMTMPQQDPADQGYPVMSLRQISSLAGYVLCADGEVSAPATHEELAAIKNYLTGGFYYE